MIKSSSSTNESIRVNPRSPRPHGHLGVGPDVVLDEAKSAGRLLVLVEPHDDPFDVARHREELEDLFLGGVEGEVADVKGRTVEQTLLLLLPVALLRGIK